MPNTPATIRVALQQPVLPAYRVPVFQSLASRPGIDLTVYYGDRVDAPSNVDEAPFKTKLVHLHEKKLKGHPIMWHAPQWRCASRKACDSLILSWDIHYASLVPGLMRAKLSGVRTVLWGHGYSKQDSALRSWPRNRVAALADALLFYDQGTANRFIEQGWDPNRIFVAPNTIDQDPVQQARQHWKERPDELHRFKQEHRLDDGPMIVFVSRLDPHNRLDLLIESLPKLAERFPGLKAVIIGKGDDERQRLETLANNLGVKDHVRFLGPIYDEKQLAAWMMCASLFCYPANIGLSVLHAFGYGLPVITSDQTSAQNPEIASLRNEGNGLTYADGSVDELTGAIARLLEDETLRQRLSSEAYRTANEVFTIDNMVDGIEAAVRGTATNDHHPVNG